MRSTISFILVLLLGGCSRGNLPTPALTEAIQPAHETAQNYTLDTAWWKNYANSALNQVVELALERNINLAQSAIAVNRAQYQARLVSSDMLPAFSATGSASATRDLTSGAGNTASGSVWQQNWRGETRVSYELDLWQKLKHSASAAEWEHRATQQDLASARLALVATVVDNWFYLVYTDQAIALKELSVKRYEQLLSIVGEKHRFGKATALEPLQAEQSLLSAKNDLANLRTQRADTLQTLRDLLNLRPDEAVYTGKRDILAVELKAVDLNVPLSALSARPDIYSAEARMNKAFKTVEATQAAWYPDISIGSTLSVSAEKASRYFDVPFLAGLVQLNLPFLDWNRLYWNSKISQSDFEASKLNLIEKITKALNEVDVASVSYVQARERFEQTLVLQQRNQQIVDYYKVRYEQGAAELKDYLDALNTADQSAIATLSTKHALIHQENRIYQAMGGRYSPLGQGF